MFIFCNVFSSPLTAAVGFEELQPTNPFQFRFRDGWMDRCLLDGHEGKEDEEQCDQMVDQKVAQYLPKVSQK